MEPSQESIEARGGWQRNFDRPRLRPQPRHGAGDDHRRARRDDHRAGCSTPTAKPVAGATVAPALTGTGNSLTGDTRFSVETDGDGRFTVLLPASGGRDYNLVAHDGKYGQWRTWANGVLPPFRTKPGESMPRRRLRLTRPATVRGRVTDAEGRPVAGREVRASAARPAARTATTTRPPRRPTTAVMSSSSSARASSSSRSPRSGSTPPGAGGNQHDADALGGGSEGGGRLQGPHRRRELSRLVRGRAPPLTTHLGSPPYHEPAPLRHAARRVPRRPFIDPGGQGLETRGRSTPGSPDPALAGRLLDHPGRRQPERLDPAGIPQGGLVAMAGRRSALPRRAAGSPRGEVRQPARGPRRRLALRRQRPAAGTGHGL